MILWKKMMKSIMKVIYNFHASRLLDPDKDIRLIGEILDKPQTMT